MLGVFVVRSGFAIQQIGEAQANFRRLALFWKDGPDELDSLSGTSYGRKSTGAPRIVIKDVVVASKDVTLACNLSLLQPEVVLLTGPSGCGKSLLVAGLLG